MPVRVPFGEFCALVQRAMESFPASFGPYLENVVVDVFDEPSAEDLAVQNDREGDGVDNFDADSSGEDLLGLFVGVPLTEQRYGDHAPNQVKIFRGPLQRVSRDRQALLMNIRATILHEFAHHFGFSEEDLDEFEETQEKWLD